MSWVHQEQTHAFWVGKGALFICISITEAGRLRYNKQANIFSYGCGLDLIRKVPLFAAKKRAERNIYNNNLLYMLGLGKERPSLYPAVQ